VPDPEKIIPDPDPGGKKPPDPISGRLVYSDNLIFRLIRRISHEHRIGRTGTEEEKVKLRVLVPRLSSMESSKSAVLSSIPSV
jgi:hypothetical protein